jgi:hypothetical protein
MKGCGDGKMKTNLAGTSSQRVPPNSVDDDGGEEGWGAEEGVAQRQAAIIQRKKIESETLLMSKRLFYLLCCYVFACTIMLWYDTIGLYAGLGFAPISLETFDFNSTNSASASTSATPSSLPPQLSPSEQDDLELPPRSVDPPIDPPELAEANADEAEPPEPEPADIEPQNSKSDEAEPSEDEDETSERLIKTVPTEQQQSRNSSYTRPLVLDAHRMKQSSNDHLPTPMDLEGFTQWGTCRFASECSPPYLHLIVPHQGRSSCFARLVRAFGPHTHKPEDVACTCLMVADVVRPPQSPKHKFKKLSSRPPKLEEKEKMEKEKDEKEEESAVDVIMGTILSWPGPHVLLRWRGPFGKLVAMDQLLHSITAPSNQSIVFVLDVDMVVKQGTLSLAHEPALTPTSISDTRARRASRTRR